MFTIDFLTFVRILNMYKKADFEDQPIFYIESNEGYELYFSNGIWKFKTFVGKGQDEEFERQFREKYLQRAIRILDVGKVTLTLE